MEQLFFAATHKNTEIEKKSSSGGAFTAITDAWFEKYVDQAVVYGCALDKNLNARHLRAVSPSERDMMRGSKYISSDISGIYQSVAKDICLGKYVVFSGTPCQIAGLRKFLEKDNLNDSKQVLTIEVICNGVADNNFFKDYITHLEKRYKGKAISCNFRGKSRAGSSTSMEIVFDNGRQYRASSTRYDWFYSLYYRNYLTKVACFNCRFACLSRGADISIGDMKMVNAGHSTKHKSLIIANTYQGLCWTQVALKNMVSEMVLLNQIDQPRLYKPSIKPNDYDRFWAVYEKEGYLAAQKFAGNNTIRGYFKTIVADVLNVLHIEEAAKKIRLIIEK